MKLVLRPDYFVGPDRLRLLTINRGALNIWFTNKIHVKAISLPEMQISLRSIPEAVQAFQILIVHFKDGSIGY